MSDHVDTVEVTFADRFSGQLAAAAPALQALGERLAPALEQAVASIGRAAGRIAVERAARGMLAASVEVARSYADSFTVLDEVHVWAPVPNDLREFSRYYAVRAHVLAELVPLVRAAAAAEMSGRW